MDETVIELRQEGGMWLATYNGSLLVCAADRSGAVDGAGAALRRLLADPATLAKMRFIGMEPSEVIPGAPAKSFEPLPSNVNFAEAKQEVARRWFPIAERHVGTAVEVVDERCVEYEWGWLIHWRPIDPEKGDPRFVGEYHFPFTVDRVTGIAWLSGGTFGLAKGIIELLQQRPPELRGPYPPGNQGWLTVIDAFEAAGAFTPLGSKPNPTAED